MVSAQKKIKAFLGMDHYCRYCDDWFCVFGGLTQVNDVLGHIKEETLSPLWGLCSSRLWINLICTWMSSCMLHSELSLAVRKESPTSIFKLDASSQWNPCKSLLPRRGEQKSCCLPLAPLLFFNALELVNSWHHLSAALQDTSGWDSGMGRWAWGCRWPRVLWVTVLIITVMAAR